MPKRGELDHLNRTYEVQSWPVYEEFETKEEARTLVESLGHGSIITWLIHDNLPYALPKRVHKSLALEVYENGKWKQVDIFGTSY